MKRKDIERQLSFGNKISTGIYYNLLISSIETKSLDGVEYAFDRILLVTKDILKSKEIIYITCENESPEILSFLLKRGVKMTIPLFYDIIKIYNSCDSISRPKYFGHHYIDWGSYYHFSANHQQSGDYYQIEVSFRQMNLSQT